MDRPQPQRMMERKVCVEDVDCMDKEEEVRIEARKDDWCPGSKF